MEWTTGELARAAGTTTRTLRHYDSLGLLTPERTTSGGVRVYGPAALPRLLRIVVMRRLGLSLAQVARVLAEPGSEADALRDHLAGLRVEQDRLARQVASVARTITALEEGTDMTTKDVFDGFDNAQYRDEVVERWGQEAWDRSNRTWGSMTKEEQAARLGVHTVLAEDWVRLGESGADPTDAEAQAVAARHVDWLRTDVAPSRAYVTGLAEMYAADPRFAANYPGQAPFVRDALVAYAATHLD